jgi:hypothetical protein
VTWISIGSANRFLAACIAAVFVLAAGADVASAKNSVVVLKFSGPRGRSLQKGVEALVKKKAKLVPESKFKRQQKRLRARKINQRDVAKVAQSMELHGVIIGKVSRKRGRYRLRVTLRAGADGAIVEDVTVNLGRKPRLTARAKKDIRRKIVGAIPDLPDPIAEPEEEEEVAVDDAEWEEEEIGGGRDDEVASGDDEPEGEVEGSADKDEPPLSKQELWNALARDRAVDVAAGVSVIARRLSFTVNAGIADQPNGYNGTLVPGAYIAAEVYPLAFDHEPGKKKGALAGLGVAVVYDKVLKISSKLEGGTVDIATAQVRWGVGVRYRLNIGSEPSGPQVKFGVGYNKLEFTLDQQAIMDNMLDIDLPNVAYTYYDPGVAGRLPIGKQMAIYADGRFLIINDTGDMQLTENYGPATVSGLDLDAGLEYRLDARLLVRGGVRYQRIAYTFDGDGALGDRDGDAMSDVPSATDQFFGGYVMGGYLF